MSAFALTDLGNARRLVAREGQDLRFTKTRGWLVWDGSCWRTDDTGEVMRRAKMTVDGMLVEAAGLSDRSEKQDLAEHALRSQARNRLENMVVLAGSEPGVAAHDEDFDADPFAFNCCNGTVDVRTGELRPHCREDLITRLSPVPFEPNATAARFERFLREVMAGDEAKVGLLQRAAGSCLTDSTSDQTVMMLTGPGANGKSTFMRLLDAALGDYHRKADAATFLEQRFDRPREDIADLRGARAVSAEEPGRGRSLDESTLKKLTGGERLNARLLYRDRFTFLPTFKIWLSFNSRPRIRGQDHGTWRRITLVEFPVTFVLDKSLWPTLEAELPGVLAWMVRGCMEWQRVGLSVPESVSAFTEEFRRDQDSLGPFFDDCCDLDPAASEKATLLYSRFVSWCSSQNTRPMSQRAFGDELNERGFIRTRTRSGVLRYGLRLRQTGTTIDNGAREQCEQSGGVFQDSPIAPPYRESAKRLLTVHTVHRNGCDADYEADERAGMAGEP